MIVYIYNIGVDLYNGFNGLRHRINWTYFTVLDGLAHPLYSIECLFRLYSSCKRNYEASNIQWLGCLVKYVESCSNQLEIDEKELVELYYFQDHSLKYVTICLGYANHSSTSRKCKSILKKISRYLYEK